MLRTVVARAALRTVTNVCVRIEHCTLLYVRRDVGREVPVEVGAAYIEVGRAVESLASTMQAWLRGWPGWRLATIDRCPRPATRRPSETRHPVDMNEIRHPLADRRPPDAGSRHNTRQPRRQQTLQPPGEPSRCLTQPCRRPRSIVSDITFSNCTEQLIWYTFY